jgi:Icc protein
MPTSTPSAGSAPFRVLQFTDCHLYGDAAGQLRGVATWPSLQATVDHALRAHGPWDATLLSGDLVQDDPTGYARIRAMFGNSLSPVYCLPGNHDDPEAMARELQSPPFTINGHARAGAWLLVLLDSYIAGSAGGHLSQDELERLDLALSDQPESPALVCLHHHPIAMGSRWLDQVGLDNGAALFAVLDRHPQVRAVVWGHVHQSYEGRRGDVRLLSTPATCAQFRPGSDGFAIDRRPPGYRWFELHADGRLETGVEWVAPAETARASNGY